jgi:hypothetical protein
MRRNFLKTALAAAASLLCLQLSVEEAPARSPATNVSPVTATYSANSPFGQLVDNPATLAILRKDVPDVVDNPLYLTSRNSSLRTLQKLSRGAVSSAGVDAADAELKEVPVSTVDLPLNGEGDNFLGIRTFRLWDGPAPASSSPDDQPSLTVMPAEGVPTGTAVIIAPGGAYLGLASGLEGREVADWFASLA